MFSKLRLLEFSEVSNCIQRENNYIFNCRKNKTKQTSNTKPRRRPTRLKELGHDVTIWGPIKLSIFN
jgi:hypothetical protein